MSRADDIRRYTLHHYVEPARAAGEATVTVCAGDIVRELALVNRTPNVCSALQSEKFLRLAGVDMLERIGPRQSTTTRFRYAIGPMSDKAKASRRHAQEPADPPRRPRIQSPPAPRPSGRRNLTVVIQCAARKQPHAGHLVDGEGRRVLFVGSPLRAPQHSEVVYRLPDDMAANGRSWRDELIDYNRRQDENALGLLPAWQLYRHSAYGELVGAFGVENVFILSAGWGLVAADFLTPNYDITFSGQVETYKKRAKRGDYADFRMLPTERTESVVFLGGKAYVDLFCTLTAASAARRFVLYNSDFPPTAPGCRCVRFETRTRTNWHYECARALISGRVDLPE